MEGERDGIAQPSREHPMSRTVGPILVDGGAARVRPRHCVGGGTDRHVHPFAIGIEDEIARPVVEPEGPADVDAQALGGIVIEGVAADGEVHHMFRRTVRARLTGRITKAHHGVVVAHVHVPAVEGDAVRPGQALREDLPVLGRAVAVLIPQQRDRATPALGHEHVAARRERKPTGSRQIVGKDIHDEAGRNREVRPFRPLHDARDGAVPRGLEGFGELLGSGQEQKQRKRGHRSHERLGVGRRTSERPEYTPRLVRTRNPDAG